jgi:hypothetical protein
VRDRFTPPTGERCARHFLVRNQGRQRRILRGFLRCPDARGRNPGPPGHRLSGWQADGADRLRPRQAQPCACLGRDLGSTQGLAARRPGRRRRPGTLSPAVRTSPKPAPPTAPRTTPAAAPRSPADSLAPPSPSGGFSTTGVPHSPAGAGWTPPDLAGWLGRWAFRLDGEHQQALLAGKGGGLAWIWLLAIAAGGSAGVFAVGLLWGRWREHRRCPLPQRAWQQACRRLASKGSVPQAGGMSKRLRPPRRRRATGLGGQP